MAPPEQSGAQRRESKQMKAYVLVQTAADTDRIAEDLEAVPGVLFAEDLRGPYDAIALAAADSRDRPLDAILTQVWELPGVIRALTAPVVRPPAGAQDAEAA